MKLRKRDILPSIVLNTDLPEMGPYHTILWMLLPMLADRMGRLEDNPKKIKAKLLPQPEYASVDVEAILDALRQKGMLLRYSGEYVVENITPKSGIPLDTSGAVEIIQIVTFLRYQKRIHPEEPPSYFSASPNATVSPCPTPRKRMTSKPPANRTCTDNGAISKPQRSEGVDPTMNIVSSTQVFSTATSIDNNRPNARAREAARSVGSPSEKPPRKPPATDLWPHTKDPQRITIYRNVLTSLGSWHHLPPPDDGILRRVMDECEDIPGPNFYEIIRRLELKHRFRDMRGYGLVPDVLRRELARQKVG